MIKVKIDQIVFTNNKIKILISYVFSIIFKKINIFFFSILERRNFFFKKQLSKNDVLVKTILCGFCSTDKKILSFNLSPFSSAFLDSPRHKKKEVHIGHELVGEVTAKGSEVKKLNIGDRVILDSVIREKVNKKILNLERFDGYSNYFIRNEKRLLKINKKLSNEKAIFIEPLACCYDAVKRMDIKNNDKILVIGAGPFAHCLIVILRYLYKKKINIVVTTKSKLHFDLIDKKLVDHIIFNKNIFYETARIFNDRVQSGFLNINLLNGYKKIFECSGDNKIINTSLRLSAKNANIILLSMNMIKIKIDPTPIWQRNLKIYGHEGYQFKYPKQKKNTLQYIHDLLLFNKINVDHIKVVKFNINNWKKVFDNKNYNGLKKVLKFKN